MSTSHIKDLFASNVERPIEEVIKVDQNDEEIIKFEIDEYVVTDAISNHYESILDVFNETPNKPRDGIGIWVSGFFGSGKSSFAKMLGLALENRPIMGTPASERFATRSSTKVQVLLKQISEKIPVHAVIFDVSTDRGIRSGNQTLTEIMYRLLLGSLGYAKDLDLAELEIGLEADGRLDEFTAAFYEVTGKEWDARKDLVAFSLGEASATMRRINPAIYEDNDSWANSAKGKADINPGKLAERATELINRRKPSHTLVFVVDEVGQFVARDVQKMLDLQAVVQQLGVKGRGKHWLVVTSQEKLNELTAGLDDRKVELARLMDRFPQQVHLEPSDISEVTSKRVLAKNAAAQQSLGDLYEQHRGQLASHTKLSADITLPELSRSAFIDLYPLLPYQIDLIIQVVSGLRTQGGASKHVGGANRTIIKLAQQLLIHPDVGLAQREIGDLARLDEIYDLVESNIEGEIRAKIRRIPEQVSHPLAAAVAKSICLLQFVQSVHRTAENIAASLYPRLGAPSEIESVKAALQVLEQANLVRKGDDGYRIPTPAEDDWDRVRNGPSPKPSDVKRLHREVLSGFWKPQPTYLLDGVKSFRAGLSIDGHEEEKGDLMVHMVLADEGQPFDDLKTELRTRSQQETDAIFWAVPLSDAIDRDTVELFRSREMDARKSRDARTPDQARLLSDEKNRARRHQAELQRLLRTACLNGAAYFRGNDRSPSPAAGDVAKATATILNQILPDVFTRFGDGAAKPADAKRGLDSLMTAADLQGLPGVFPALNLLRDESGKTVIDVENCAALNDVFAEIEEGANLGRKATGKSLTERFGNAPFGWDMEVVRLFVASLMRAGKIQMTHKGEAIDDPKSVSGKDGLGNNNHFKAASFQPKKGIDFEELIKANQHYKATFGSEIKELSESAVASAIRTAIDQRRDSIEVQRNRLAAGRLPGLEVLDDALAEARAIMRGTEGDAIVTFNSAHERLKDGIKRAAELEQQFSDDAMGSVERSRRVLMTQWVFLDREADLEAGLRDTADQLRDYLEQELFFQRINDIEAATKLIEDEHDRRFGEALQAKVQAYAEALSQLVTVAEWPALEDTAKQDVAAPLQVHADDDGSSHPSIPQLRADRDACLGRLREAIQKVQQIVEGDRMIEVSIEPFFRGGVSDLEQLESALQGLREECERHIAADKKIFIR
jgi:Family of unknown function (DUF6079)